jgi:glycosyltransferase involved in cell wall biosynthesis
MQVSVIIPTYNSARYLAEAVDSVLSQTFSDFEVLVIDDGSTDETETVMRRYGPPVRYIQQNNGGVASARNRGIEESRGRYVAFLDADDTWYPHKLQRQLAALDEHADYLACYSAFTIVTSDLAPLGVTRSKRQTSALEDLLLRGNVVGSICTVLCDRLLFKSTGAFDPALSQCADWDMWVRLAALTDFLYIDEPLVTYRQHETNMSRNAPLLERDSLLVLEKGFAMPDLSDSLRMQRRAAFARNYMVLAGTYFHARHYRDFSRCAALAIGMDFRQVARLLAFPVRRTSYLLHSRNGETAQDIKSEVL